MVYIYSTSVSSLIIVFTLFGWIIRGSRSPAEDPLSFKVQQYVMYISIAIV